MFPSSSVRTWFARGSRLVGLSLLVLSGAGCSRSDDREAPKRSQPVQSPPSAHAPSVSAPSVSAPSGSPTAGASPGIAEDLTAPDEEPETLAEQKEALVTRMERVHRLTREETARVRDIFSSSKPLSQGNPDITEHPMTRSECRKRRSASGPLPAGDALCGRPNMAALYDPGAGEDAARAKVCIDQYEFPNIPCEYPVVYARAIEAAELCKAVGKRLCDAHEWEGACAGALLKPELEYAFGQRRLMMEYLHNKDREIVWAYGRSKDHAKCATASKKSPKCHAGGWTLCGSNTFPAGAFPECRSRFGVFDLHGNAAEHMNLPLKPEELASRGGLGETEMKGSWFIFASGEAHVDDCRWRAPQWHHTRVADPNSHSNYHLGFRCCRDVEGSRAP